MPFTPVSVLDQESRNGTFDSASIAVPAIDPDTGQPYAVIRLASTMSSADGLNAANTALTYILVSYDGSTYVTAQVTQWAGGSQNRNGSYGPNVGISIPADANGDSPVRVMARLDTQGNLLNTGLTLGFA